MRSLTHSPATRWQWPPFPNASFFTSQRTLIFQHHTFTIPQFKTPKQSPVKHATPLLAVVPHDAMWSWSLLTIIERHHRIGQSSKRDWRLDYYYRWWKCQPKGSGVRVSNSTLYRSLYCTALNVNSAASNRKIMMN